MRTEARRRLDVFNKVDATFKQMQVERANMFHGKTLNKVEVAFQRKIDSAKSTVIAHIEIAKSHNTTETRCIEALPYAQQHMAQLRQAASGA